MGSAFFHKGKVSAETTGPKIGAGNLNMMARAQGAPAYAGARSTGVAAKDLAAAAAFGNKPGMPGKKTAASDAPGPKV